MPIVSGALLVPNHAITALGRDKVVYILANSQVNPVVVTVGLASDTQTEITSTTLKTGDVVITNPTTLSTAMTTSTSSIFANLFQMLGVTTAGTTRGGPAGGPPGGFGGGGFPAGGGGFPAGGGGFPAGGGPTGGNGG
jgi:hypothetical protein